VTELPVSHHPGTRGKSHYGIGRSFKVVLDMIVVTFLMSYATKPIYVFGGFGLLSPAAAAVVFPFMVYLKLARIRDFVATPLPLVVVVVGHVGCLAILLGLVAELTVRKYSGFRGKRPYAIQSIEGGD
jgi:hypothetical protein